MISKTVTTLRQPRNKCIISTVFIIKLGCGCVGLYSLDFMFFPFRLKYVKVSLQYLSKVRLTLQRTCQPPCSLGEVYKFTNRPLSTANTPLKCALKFLLLPPPLPRGPACTPAPACLCCLRKPSLAFLLPCALWAESDTNTCHPRKCLCCPPFCVRGHREPVDPEPPPFLLPKPGGARS